MSNNYDDYGYEDKDYDDGSAAKKRILIGFLIVAAIIIVVLLILKGCSKNDKPKTPIEPTFNYEKTLLEAGKKYYENNIDLLPIANGECGIVELSTLESLGLVNPENFSTCDKSTTYVKVCVLPNGTKQYTPWLSCTEKNSDTEYADEKEGTISDIVPDESLVRFTFMPKRLKAGAQNLGPVEEMWKDEIKYASYKTVATTKYYRYRDQLFIWKISDKTYYTSSGEKKNSSDVKDCYTVSPNSNDNLSSDKTTEAYKWFTTTGGTKTYALNSNGEKVFSKTAIKDYVYADGGIKIEYQTRTQTGSGSEPYHFYVCGKYSTSTVKKYQLGVKCGEDPEDPQLSYTFEEFYSCSKGDYQSIEADRVKKGDKCYTYSDWKDSSKSCDVSLPTCRKITPVYYYNWYKLTGGTKSYYPSGSSTASGEKVYYTDAPVAGATKDSSTKATAYKWYKATETETTEYTAVAPKGYADATKTNKSKWGDWTEYSTKNPKVSDGRNRQIETKTKIKLQEIKGTTDSSWEDLSTTYVSEEEMINIYKQNKYNVNSLEDINNNGELKYDIKMIIRNKKEASQ